MRVRARAYSLACPLCESARLCASLHCVCVIVALDCVREWASAPAPSHILCVRARRARSLMHAHVLELVSSAGVHSDARTGAVSTARATACAVFCTRYYCNRGLDRCKRGCVGWRGGWGKGPQWRIRGAAHPDVGADPANFSLGPQLPPRPRSRSFLPITNRLIDLSFRRSRCTTASITRTPQCMIMPSSSTRPPRTCCARRRRRRSRWARRCSPLPQDLERENTRAAALMLLATRIFVQAWRRIRGGTFLSSLRTPSRDFAPLRATSHNFARFRTPSHSFAA
eukprot:3201480-Pleurochrysis_carterae.AAC.1